ncbi:hypothetical protein VTJ49DRAFT_2675 [Mycothermus thermophilus]|uniref:AMMECR1 domain-containing protein n=1 Tax=Humicola insolens TaxID=85995 RepID=A0ABR3V9H5_HUMIN
MATVEHCLLCFEALAAHYDNRKPMTLSELQKSWAAFQQSTTSSEPKRLPALRRVTDEVQSTSSSSSTTSSASASTLSLGTSTPATSESEPEPEDPADPDAECPLFVTWNKPAARHPLRGCIGTFEAQELSEGLTSYALISALQDTRFRPIAKHEMPSLEVAVTLLTDFEDVDDAMDWELGKHGLRIAFREGGRRYGATYLPDVAAEMGWTKEETIVSLMRKAGWDGPRDRWRDVELDVVRYQGKKARLEYAEFKRWRDWVDGQAR